MLLLAFGILIAGPSLPGEVRVQLLNASRAPVANAEVRWFSLPAPRFDLERIDELAHASGNLSRSDDAGQVFLDVPGVVHVVGRTPSLWGWGSTKADATEFTLTLVEDRDLVAITVDANGQPVGGVPVKAHKTRSSNETAWTELVWSATSDASTGRAVWRHASHTFFEPRRASDVGHQQFFVGTDVMPFRRRDGPWSGQTVPKHPIELKVAETREVELRVTESDRTPAVGRVRLLEFAPEGVPDLALASDRSWSERERLEVDNDFSSLEGRSGAGWQQALLVQGNARLRALIPETRFVLEYQRNAASLPIPFPFHVPPKAEGNAVVDLDLASASNVRTIVLRPTVDRVVVGAGSVTVQRFVDDPRVRAEIWRIGGVPELAWIDRARHPVELDASGRLVLDVASSLWTTSEVCVRWSDERGDREAWVDTRILAVGRHDFGDVELEPTLIALAGVVRDFRGQPIVGAQLVAQSQVERALANYNEADGSFEFRSNRKDAYDLFATAPGYFSESVFAVQHGTTDLRIELNRPVRVSGSLDFGPLASVEGLSVLLLRVAEGDSIDSAPGISRSCRCAGPFEFEGVRPGRYTLLVRRSGQPGRPIDLFRRDGVEIRPGHDFDLGPIRID